MCGIFGYFFAKGLCHSRDFVEEQFHKGWNRGPENSNFFKIDKVGYLGFHRLAINGLNEGSNQPLIIDKIYLICNGEIYNYRELYKKMGIEPITESDCEIIIHLYMKYSMDYLLQLLDGVFSFILYDSVRNVTFVARDPYGVRPLYWSSKLVFASDLKQLTEFGNNHNINHFKPGTFLKIDNQGVVTSERYSTFGFSTIHMPMDQIYKNIYSGLQNAVKKRVIGTTDRPVACLLSGGLDSSLITAFVNSFLPKGKLETYSIGLPGSTDLKYAKIVAEYLGTNHTELVVTEDDFFNAIPDVIYNIETYDTTSVRASVGNYLIGKHISLHSDAKVIFNGDGSDELTGGYLYFNAVPDSMEFDKECRRLLSDIYQFDVLRSDKCISSHGLEPRTPFLDRSFVQMYLGISPEIRNHTLNNKPGKYLLRESIQLCNPTLLPKEVLNRTKEAFSDGVSALDRSWFSIIKEKTESFDLEFFDTSTLIHNTPKTQEMKYYRIIFERDYPTMGHLVPYFWMPRYTQSDDPSARTLKEYSEK